MSEPEFSWRPFPMARLLVTLVSGIALALVFGTELSAEQVQIAQWICVGMVLIFVLLHFYFQSTVLRPYHALLGVWGLFCLMLIGFSHTCNHNQRLDKQHFTNQKDSILYSRIRLVTEATIKPKHTSFLAEITAYKSPKGWQSAKGRIKVYLRQDSSAGCLEYGDALLLKGTPSELEPPKNPFQFDYKAFLGRQNVYHQLFVEEGAWLLLEKRQNFSLMACALKARHYADSVLKAHLDPRTEEYGVAAALLLGLRTELDEDLLGAYSVSGTMHILAVSGMHVMLLFLVLDWLLTRFKVKKRGNWSYMVFALLLLWSYAMLTGLSASVLRAAAMLSVVVVADTFGKRKNVYNSLSVSAFGLLLYCPYLLLDVGFQLSYLAVLGIVFIHRQLYSLYDFEGYLSDLLWQVFCVSLAAQIMTMPISLYYFDQFPTYFLLANMLIVPWNAFMMYSGLLLLLFHWVPYLSWLLAMATKWQIWLMNRIVLWIDSLYLSSFEHIHLDLWEVLTFYLLLFCLFHFFVYARFKYLILSVLIAILWLGGSFLHYQKTSKQKIIMVLHTQQQANLLLLNGQEARLWVSPSLLLDYKTFKNNILPLCNAKGIIKIRTQAFDKPFPKISSQKTEYGHRIYWEGLCIDHLEKPLKKPLMGQTDIVLVSQNALFKLDRLAEVAFQTIVLDASNKPSLAKRLEKEALKHGLELHNVGSKGAWILER